MFGKGGLGNLMKQAQQMQEKMQKMQEEIAQLEVTGESGAGLVKVTINGAHNCRRVEIDPSLLEDDKEMLEDLQKLPEQVELLLNNKNKIQKFANRYLAAKDVFFIGRGIDYAISMEGSLKLKEISYIHSEAYAAGELKHGTISLIEEGTLVAAVLTQEDLYKKMISNMEEVRTRGAFVMAVTNEGNTDVERVADYVIYIPETNRYFANSLAIIPLQLFGYYVSVGRGCDVDKPRNLAKSVTVE